LRPRAILAAALVTALGLALALRLAPASAAPSELFFSEYVEGSSNNKALEIYNGTGAAVTLTGVYDVQIFANGGLTASATIPLTGTVADGDVFVLAQANAVAAVLGQADQTTTNFLWNGDDAVALRKNGAILDVIGQIGVDPGGEWGTGDASTADNTLRRKAAIQAGDPEGSDAFDPVGQWEGFPIDSFDGLGTHTISTGGGPGGGAPNAVADSAVVDEDAGPTAIPVLANDSDPDGDSLAITAASDGAHGTVAITGGGNGLTYAPEVDYNGADSFTYTVSDGQGGEDTATVSVTVSPVNDDPDAEDDAAATPEDAAVTIAVVANDSDPDGDPVAVVDVDEPLHGTAALTADGTSIVYEPEADFNGADVVEYTIFDGNGGTEFGEVAITVTPVNDPPTARPDLASVRQGQSVVIDVLANDVPGPADEMGQTLTVTSVGAAAHGQAELLTSGPDQGKVRYTPSSGYEGSDSFTYEVSDGGASAAGTVNVVVGPPLLSTICGLTPTILGTPGDDVITGTPGDDVVRARRGNDAVDGGGGDDVVCAGPGADSVTTGDGRDRIAGGSGPDTIGSGVGQDHVRGGFGSDDISTGPGNDAVAAGAGDDTVDAGDGDNSVSAGAGDDSVRAGSGNDRIDGGLGTDTCDADGGRNSVVRCE
jgi:Ca2+-binding RTX toxin-like protein